MEKARYNTELYSNLREPLNNVKPSNFWGSHHFGHHLFFVLFSLFFLLYLAGKVLCVEYIGILDFVKKYVLSDRAGLL